MLNFKNTNVKCEGYTQNYGCDGTEYECGYYDKTGICVTCDDCVCNFGSINPVNGKRINFILRFIQNRRAVKYFEHKTKNVNQHKERNQLLCQK